MTLAPLLRDLTILLLTAAVVTLLFRKLRLPLILGYLTAGLLVSPFFPLFENVVDPKNLESWADIGVIFLLFSLGLEFSYKRLLRMGKSPLLTGVGEVAIVFLIGLTLSLGLGWSLLEAAFMGAALSISSTSIVARSFRDLGLEGRRFVNQVFGVLLVEDGLAILLLVALSTLGSPQGLNGWDLAQTAVRFLFFLGICFVSGTYLVPLFLRKVRPLLSNETTLVVSIGLCLSMVVASVQAGFSAAMGAFLMGSILAGTPDGPRIEQLLEPLKDLFAAIFFVSIGMLIDLGALVENAGWVFLFAAALIIGKFIAVTTCSLLTGQKFRNSVQAGLSLTQIGEFSFLIAKLGLSRGVTSPSFFPLVILISVVTSSTTPLLLRFSDPLLLWLEGRLPGHWHHRLEVYQRQLTATDYVPRLRLIWRAYGWKILMNSIVIVGITLFIRRVAWDFLLRVWPLAPKLLDHCAVTATIMLSLPFFWALLLGGPARELRTHAESLRRLRGLQLGVGIIRALIASSLLVFIVSQFLSPRSSLWMMLGLLLCLYLMRTNAARAYQSIEGKFLDHLNEKEREELLEISPLPELAPWDAELAEVCVHPDSPHVGQSYLEAGLRDRYGVIVALIERGSRRILAPNREETLFPGDRLYLIGTEEQILHVRSQLEVASSAEAGELSADFGLEFLVIEPQSEFIGRKIRESGLREKLEGLVVGLERAGRRILNPDSNLALETWDLVWIVGSRRKIEQERRGRPVKPAEPGPTKAETKT